MDPLADPEERRVLYAALDSFQQYRRAAHYNITHVRRQAFYSLPSAQVDLLSEPPFSLPKAFDAVDKAIDANADLAEAILATGLSTFGIAQDRHDWRGYATPDDLDKARSTIRQVYRDWSSEGGPERYAAFTPIFSALEKYLPSAPPQRHQHRILVPGAGLGRLVFDLCMLGYSVEGNEISYHQLVASNYLLNCTLSEHQHKLYPWALSFSNHLTRDNQMGGVEIPDIHPGSALATSATASEVPFSERMSMSAGDFCQSYTTPEAEGAFNAVATCFFIDTAPNVITYINAVKHCLKPGGVWINIGPLLWHFEAAPTPAEREYERNRHRSGHNGVSRNQRGAESSESAGIGDPGSFELSDAEVVALLARLGFEVLEHKQVPAGASGYIQDPASMLQNIYRPSFWVARKL